MIFKIHCYYCNSIKTNKVFVVNSYPIYQCVNCDILFTGLPKKYNFIKINRNIYTKTYIRNYKKKETYLINRFRNRLYYIEKIIHGGKLLDVGCGIGTFLYTVRKYSRYAWKLFGVDVNNLLIRFRISGNGGVIYNTKFSDMNIKRNFFDCITCFDVLEHDINITNNINKIRFLLKTNGLLVIQSPNYKSIVACLCGKDWDWWSPPDHIYHFSVDFLVKLLIESGFEILSIKTQDSKEDFIYNIKSRLIRKRKSCSNRIITIFLYILYIFSSILNTFFNFGGLLIIYARKKD